MQSFFIPPEWIVEDQVSITGWLVHQLRDVLRVKANDRILVLDGSGWEYEVQLKRPSTQRVSGKVIAKYFSQTEPRTRITLYQALLKGSRFEFVLQKCTELGVTTFVPTICDRCVMGNLANATSSKIVRWKRIIQEAAEQSGRSILPPLQPPLLFRQACEQANCPSLMPWEGERSTGLQAALKEQASLESSPVGEGQNSNPPTLNLFIGPEGGFSDAEVEFACTYGIKPVSLGHRILRAETAAVAAVAAILYECGDLGG